MPEIFNKKFFLETGYKVTEEPLGKLSEEVRKLGEWSLNLPDLPEERIVSSRDIVKLKKIIKRFPNETILGIIW